MVRVIPQIDRGPTSAEIFAEKFQAGKRRQREEAMAAEKEQAERARQRRSFELSGLPPELADSPIEFQKAYLKQKFTPEKKMTSLQETQQELAQERLNALKGQQKLFGDIFGNASTSQQSEQQDLSNQEFHPETSQGFDISKVPVDKLRKAAAFAGQPGEAGILGNIAQAELDRKEKVERQRTEKQKEYFKFNEPKLAELSDTSRKLDIEEARFNRLGKLFSESEKFPSPFTAALFSKEGQINDKAYALLSPEAQESIKLIVDSTSNIKDTYGARVTNFDLQTYLKKLPSLLNSPEGKMRVLRDLQIINQLNKMHADGIQEIFEKAGGTDKIPYSTAESRYKKEYRVKENELLDLFVNPEKGDFKELPDAKKYLGRKIEDPETGEIFISDGNEWKPFRG
jgi:hypothetical protein